MIHQLFSQSDAVLRMNSDLAESFAAIVGASVLYERLDENSLTSSSDSVNSKKVQKKDIIYVSNTCVLGNEEIVDPSGSLESPLVLSTTRRPIFSLEASLGKPRHSSPTK